MPKKVSLKKINNLLIILLLLLVAFNFYETIKLKEKLAQGNAATQTPATPAPETPKGNVTATILSDRTCTSCINMSMTVEQFQLAGVAIKSQQTVDTGSAEGKQLIQKYSIKTIPTLILSNEIKDYSQITGFWAQVGTVEADGNYVTRTVSPPYINLTTGKTAGLVELTVLTDKSCSACYNASEHLLILESMGITLAKTTYTDIAGAEGKQLITKYKITAAPTIMLSADAKYYSSLQSSWTVVGTVEADGTHVFRNFTAWTGNQTYKDLTTGKTVTG